jgi:hypothetical protein
MSDARVELGKLKESAVKTMWICGLLSLVSIVAYGQILVALIGAADLRLDTKTSPTDAVAPPLLNTPVGVLARNASSGRPAPDSTRTVNDLTPNLSTYLLWHKTWNEAAPAWTAEQLGMCTE